MYNVMKQMKDVKGQEVHEKQTEDPNENENK